MRNWGLLAAVVCCLGLAACGDHDDDATDRPAAGTTTAPQSTGECAAADPLYFAGAEMGGLKLSGAEVTCRGSRPDGSGTKHWVARFDYGRGETGGNPPAAVLVEPLCTSRLGP